MTSFLRKKNKQDSPTKSANAASVTSSTSPPPLFARFTTTAQKDGGTARMVSGPMMLSSQRKDLPQRGLSGNGFGYSSTSLAAGNRDGDATHIRKMPESHQPPPPASRANPSSPKSPRPDSRLFVDKPLPPPAPDAPITSTVPAVGRRATAAQSPGPPPVFQTQPVRGRASLDNYVPDTTRTQPLQRAGSAQAQYAPYKFAPTPPPKTNGSISKPPMGNGPSSQGPPPAFARQHLPTSGNLTSQTLSPRFNHATLDGVNGIGGELPAKRMSLVADVQRTPMSDRAIDLPPEAALFQDYSETISIPSAPNSLNSRRPLQSASGNTVNAKVTEQVPNLSNPRSSIHLVGDAQPTAVPYQPPRPESQYPPSPPPLQNYHFTPSPPQPRTTSPPLPPPPNFEMGTTASRAFSPDFISSSSFKDMSPARFMISSNSPPPTSFSTNISNAVSPQRSPLKKSAKSNSISSSPPLPQAPSIVAVPPGKPQQHNVQHSRNSPEAYQAQQQQPYPQYQFSPPQSRPQSQYQQPQAGPPPTMPHAPPSSHHFSPGQAVPAALRKSPSMQSANAPQRGKPRIFAAMEARENEDSMQAAGPSLPPPVTQQKQVDVSSNQLLQGHPSLNYQQPPSQPQLVNQPPLLPPVEFMTPKSRIEDLPDLYGNLDQRGLSSSSASLLSSSPSKGTSRHVGGSDPLLRTPRSDSVRSLSKPEEPPQQLASPQATPRSRKLSKARSNADTASVVSLSTNVSGPGAPSTPEGRRLHTHASHRSISKSRPSTPATQNKGLPVQPEVGIIRVDEDAAKVGVPLDEDPFARVEGVKVLNATTPPPVKENGSMKPSEELNAPTNEGSAAGQNLGKNGAATATPLTPVSPEDKKKSKRERKSSKAAKSGEIAGSKGKEKEKQVSEPVTLVHFLSDPQLLSTLLSFLSFYDWCTLSAISKQIRIMFVRTPDLREAILESHLKTIGYSRWCWDDKEPLSLSLQDLNDYMRGVSTPNHEYARVAAMYVHSLSIHPNHRDPSLAETVQALTASTRAYTRVLLRLRAQAEKEASVHSLNNSQPPPSASSFKTRTGGGTSSRVSSRAPSPTTSMYSHGVAGAPGSIQQASSASQTSLTFRSPLFKLRRAPLLRVFVPSPEGDWLSDKSVLECEAECKRAGIVHLLRLGDVVWDVAVGDEGNVGRLVWDGSYLIDLDYTYSPVGDLPKYLPTLAFPPSYFHRVIRTGPNVTNPIVHIDISPWGEEIAMNLQLLQDRVRTETPQGAYHNVVRWVHRSSFTVRPSRSTQRYTNTPPKPGQSQSNNGRIPIPDSNGLFVDPGWYGTIVVETEGTNEALADLQDRCGPGAFPPRPRGVNGQMASQAQIENRKVFRILRERSRPGEIWIKAVNVKERLL